MRKISILAAICVFFFSTFAGAQEYRLYFGGTHSHTSFSDGMLMPENAWDTARYKGKADFWFITEHYQSLANVESLPPGQPQIKEWEYELKSGAQKNRGWKIPGAGRLGMVGQRLRAHECSVRPHRAAARAHDRVL